MTSLRRTANLLSASLERMIAIQAGAYPSGWSEEDKREMARRELGILDRENEDE